MPVLSQFMGLFMGLIMAVVFSAPSHAINLFVTSPSTGSAIHGFDPVAYFDKHAAVMGIDGLEAEWSNVYWKFSNAANKERFLESPLTFAPRFNGYGAYSVAQGRLAEGNPHIWIIYENKLLFFYSAEARLEWIKNPEKFSTLGNENWKKLSLTLSR